MKKSKKHILMQSLIAMVLCVSMLAGATFAWFTDSEVIGNNIIATGTLNVKLYHSSAVVADEAVTESTMLFLDDKGNQILWEPGVVSWENLRIANVGELALSYKFSLTTANENFIIDGENQYGLSQALKIGLVPGGLSDTSSREAVIAAVTEWKPLASFSDVGWLKPATEESAEDETSFGIVVYWEPGENDNRWNLNNGKTLNEGEVLSIDLGVQLLASQQPYETDSFDENYDFDASYFFEGVSQESSNVTTENGQVSEGATIGKADSTVSAQVAAGTKVNTDELVLTVKRLENSSANVQVEADQVCNSVDVHVEGLAADNTVPVIVTVKEMMPAGMNVGNYTLYHVENGTPVAMTLVDGTPVNHNEYTYDPGTGTVTMALASFSEVMVVSDNINMWLGIIASSFNGGSGTDADPFIIANADQLALMSKLVSGDTETINGYKGVKVQYEKASYKLHADIDFGGEANATALDGEASDVRTFYPIGAWKYKETDVNGKKIYVRGDQPFQGHFDGNGNTIRGIYQNTWAMGGTYNDGYPANSNYWKTSMGLFDCVFDARIENLCIDNFQSDGEFTPTGCVAAFAGGNSVFEDIILLNSNPRVYNTGNGGIVGLNYNSTSGEEDHLVFRDITVDSSNTISALWGSYDVSCGGILGRIRENSKHVPEKGNTNYSSGFNTVTFENCNVSAVIDVYNDVCANYQYYQYRYCGMLIGTCDYIGDVPEIGYEDVVTATKCTVTYGPWNEYWYCELVANSLASYTHDHQFSRLEKVQKVDVANMTVTTLQDKVEPIPTEGRKNYVVVEGENKDENGTCFHFVDGKVHNHSDYNGDGQNDYETVGEQSILVEDRQHYFLPFRQLFTGYGWGSSPVTELKGVTIKDHADEVAKDKFKAITTLEPEYPTETEFDLSELFTGTEDINDTQVEVFLSPVGQSTANAVVDYDYNNWENTKLTISGVGVLKITVADYDNCKLASTYVNIISNDHLAHCIGGDAGCTHTQHTNPQKVYGWQPWNGWSDIYESGNYYLTQDVTGANQRQLGALRVNENNKENFNIVINLCLNGHKIDANSRVFGLGYGVTVNLMDCCNAGVTLTGRGVRSDGTTEIANRAQAGVILQQAKSTLHIYNNITLELKGYESGGNTYYPRSAGVIEVASNSKLYLHDNVTLKGNKVETNWYAEDKDGNKSGIGGNAGTVYLANNCLLEVEPGVTIYGGSVDTVAGNIQAGSGTEVILEGKVKGGSANSAGCVYLASGAVFRMNGSTAEVSGGETRNGAGGNFYLANGSDGATLTVTGGVISGGVAKGGHGGNIYVGNNATVTLTGCTVQNGEAQPVDLNSTSTDEDYWDKNGGNIFMGENGSTVTIGQSAKVQGGDADRGGNIFLYAGKLNITGDAQITGGTARNKGYGSGGGCIHLNAYKGENLEWFRSVTLAGTPEITELRVSNNVLSKDKNGQYHDTVDASGLTGGTIGIYHVAADDAVKKNESCQMAFATNGTGKLSFFTNAHPNLITEEKDGVLYLSYHGAHCTCGKTSNHSGQTDGCETITGEWKPWDGKSWIMESGNYYLTQDITGGTQQWIGNGSGNDTEMTINLCLNGHSIASENRVFGVAPKVTFNLMNCSSTKSVLSGKGSDAKGGVMLIFGKDAVVSVYDNIEIVGVAGKNLNEGGAIECWGKLNLYGTVVKGTALVEKVAGNGGNAYKDRGFGGAIYGDSNAVITLNGATIYGSQVTGDGGAIYLAGSQLTINEGTTIYAGDVDWLGGAICARDAAITMNGGTIDGNNTYSAVDGNHAVRGGGVLIENSTFTMNGGTIQNCMASSQGGAICVNSGTLTVGGSAKIQNCSASGTLAGGNIYMSGGNIYMSGGTFNMTGGTITGGNAPTNGSCGGSICVEAGTFNISGGTVTGGTATYGSAIFTSGTVNISGNAQITGTYSNNLKEGGAVYIFVNGVVNMNGGTITGCKVNDFGGAVTLYQNAKMTLTSGTIRGSTETRYGGAVYLSSKENEFIMNGGTIQGGKASVNGGNICMDAGTFTMTAGTITGGTANRGGNIEVAGGTFTMSGDTIQNGNATNSGSNVYVRSTGTFEQTGGTVSGGNDASILLEAGVVAIGGTATVDGKVLSTKEAITNGAQINLSGTPVISLLRMERDDRHHTIVSISGLESAARITFTSNFTGYVSIEAATEAQADCFVSYDDGYGIVFKGGRVWWDSDANIESELSKGVVTERP